MSTLETVLKPPVRNTSKGRLRQSAGYVYQQRILSVICWLYLVFLLLVWGCLRYGADRHWLGTLLEFGPRWMLLIPLVPLMLAALAWHRHLGWIVAAQIVFVLGPVCGMSLPIPGFAPANTTSTELRLLTLNTDGCADPSQVIALVEKSGVELVFLQECSQPQAWVEHFGPDWHIRHLDEFIIAAKFPLTELEPLILENQAPWDRYAVRCQLIAPQGRVNLVNLHTYSPRRGLEAVRHREQDAIVTLQANMARRAKEASAIAHWVSSLDGPTVLAGDFNQTAGSAAYELQWGQFSNAFSESGFGWGATLYSRWHGVRIDHILFTQDWRARECWSADHVGSAHRPVITTLAAR